MDNYRIYRIDPNNLAIQKRRGKEWRTISYHGNSHFSLISGLFELILAQHTPEREKISEALGRIELELVSGIEEVKEMIKEWGE